MNNIYVDGEFLNHCNDCPFYDIETEVEFVGYEKNYHKCLVGGDIITGNCPLKFLSTRLAEERKKMVQEIKEKAFKKEIFYTGKKSEQGWKNEYWLFDFELEEIERNGK